VHVVINLVPGAQAGMLCENRVFTVPIVTVTQPKYVTEGGKVKKNEKNDKGLNYIVILLDSTSPSPLRGEGRDGGDSSASAVGICGSNTPTQPSPLKGEGF